VWQLYGEVVSGRSSRAAATAFDILTVLETDLARLHRFRDNADDLLPRNCRIALLDDE